MLRPGKRPSGHEIRGFVRRLVGAIRALWPKVEILWRGDSHCRSASVRLVPRQPGGLGLRPGPNAALSRHVAALDKNTAERFTAAPTHGKTRRFTQFYDAAQSWSQVERIIARVEAGPAGIDTRSCRWVRGAATLPGDLANGGIGTGDSKIKITPVMNDDLGGR
jgi:Transposase DDE domain group 1